MKESWSVVLIIVGKGNICKMIVCDRREHVLMLWGWDDKWQVTGHMTSLDLGLTGVRYGQMSDVARIVYPCLY